MGSILHQGRHHSLLDSSRSPVGRQWSRNWTQALAGGRARAHQGLVSALVNRPYGNRPSVQVPAGHSDHCAKTQVQEVVQGVEMDEAVKVAVAAKSGRQEPDDACGKVDRAKGLREHDGRLRPCEGDDREAHAGQQVDDVVSAVGQEQPWGPSSGLAMNPMAAAA
jgi:hypothetical protein